MLQKLIFHKHLEEGERILYAVHKHWVSVLNPTIRAIFFGVIIPWGLYAIGFNTIIFFWVAVIWSSFVFLHYFYELINWYSDAFLITTAAIVWIEWGGIFKNAATRTGFQDIEGVSYEISGFWPTLLDYGQVRLKSISGNVIELYPARKPKEVELKIMQYQQSYLQHKDMEDAGKLKQLLSQMVSSHFRREGK